MDAINDYELIYLIQNYQDGVAFETLLKKYEPLIKKLISEYSYNYKDYDDLYQESSFLLYKLAVSFSEDKNKTFTRYFESNLKWMILGVLSKKPKYILREEVDNFPCDDSKIIVAREMDISKYDFTVLEKQVYDYLIIENMKPINIIKILNINSKVVYNAISRIKAKMK
ncbi:MAG: hypothetical protein LBV51_02485 [Acholeplasmatales bacterium]|jgi:RNA polymerase sporulation-specific sigma factor|nr:hypothetical protein [Acholeplasmatales bacterium]